MPWVVPAKPECYLKMFPEPSANSDVQGQVFGFTTQETKAGRQVVADLDQWDKCKECYYYTPCYNYGLARLLLSRRA